MLLNLTSLVTGIVLGMLIFCGALLVVSRRKLWSIDFKVRLFVFIWIALILAAGYTLVCTVATYHIIGWCAGMFLMIFCGVGWLSCYVKRLGKCGD